MKSFSDWKNEQFIKDVQDSLKEEQKIPTTINGDPNVSIPKNNANYKPVNQINLLDNKKFSKRK